MNQRISPRLLATFGVSVAAVVGLGLLLVFLSRGPGAPTPMTTPVAPTPTDDPTVVTVNGRPIKYSFWMETVLLDQVMSGIAAQPAATSDEALQRLINEELVLEAFPPEQEPTPEQIEEQIAKLEEGWGVSDDAVVMALENVGLDRATFGQAVGRLLAVQAGLETLQGKGYDVTAWLEEQRAGAEIVLNQEFDDAMVTNTPIAQSPFQSPLATATTSPLPTPTPMSAAELSPLPSPTPAQAILEAAPDFTLRRAGGGQFILTEQLAQGPVVLVFFQKCG